jgi:hypothetical protein
MKRSKILSLSALYLISHAALAAEPTQRVESGMTSTEEVISAIRIEVVAATKLADEFESLAGSRQNAEKLVVGLRNAKPVTIVPAVATPTTPQQREVSFTPATRPLSFPDIHKALSLAQAHLQSKHILNPTPAQLGAALAGGDLPNAQGDMTRVIGILPLHQRGMSWEQIARALHVAPPKRVATVQRETRVGETRVD